MPGECSEEGALFSVELCSEWLYLDGVSSPWKLWRSQPLASFPLLQPLHRHYYRHPDYQYLPTETRRVRLRSPAHCCCLRHHGRCHLFSLCQVLTSLQHQQRQPGDTLLFLLSTLSSRFSVHPLSLPSHHFGCFFARSLSQHASVNMRYEDWDILLFPRGCSVPMKEFKVACHVVHDLGEPTFNPFVLAGSPCITRSN